MKKDNFIYLKHILTCTEKIISYTKNMAEEEFLKNELVQDAVIRNFEIIGEATKHLSKEFRNQYQHIPWRDIAGMRDVLIHDYIGVDIWAVWSTVEKYVPKLREDIEKIMKEKE